ncbi:MAG: FHA domain-containing protein [Ancrocorticia sp.]
MTTLVLTLLRLGFLALLWIFVISLVLTVRKDVYGTEIRDRRMPNQAAPEKKTNPLRRFSFRRAPRATPTAASAPSPAAAPQPPPRTPTLAVTGGPLAGTTLPLGQTPIVIGRSPDSALVLDDTFSSSRHARLYANAGQWWIEDLDSTNGTFVGGAKISTPTPLQPGIPIMVGKTTMELRS